MIEDDCDRTDMLEDFGQQIILNPKSPTPCTVVGIYDRKWQDFGEDLELSGYTPAVLCKEQDVSDIKIDDDIRVDTIFFKVRDTQPDGTGFTRLILKDNT